MTVCEYLEQMTKFDLTVTIVSWAVIYVCGVWKMAELTGKSADATAKWIIRRVERKYEQKHRH